jgi:hypothetical protein
MWEPQPLATLRASMAHTGITLPLPYIGHNSYEPLGSIKEKKFLKQIPFSEERFCSMQLIMYWIYP